MQFARPTAPQPQHVELNGLLRGVVEMLEPLAQERQVSLVSPEPPAGYAIYADAGQVRQALTCLLRNAIEAASSAGWAGLRVQPADAGALDIYVEDNGPGPSASAVDHLFDPFYSGRSAGRGRGLGLTTAWRLARQNHGDVHYAGHAAGVTRFVLHLSQVRLQSAEPANGQHPPAAGSAIIVSTSC
jgi:two-component system NtrC family sensor kinase